MELVYLWVEEYKNIKKQGFNFSPRFKCEFFPIYEKYTDKNGEEKEKLKDNCELIIDENKDYVSLFPDNINITAIVGENGSGKSSLLNGITNGKIIVRLEKELQSNDFGKDKFLALDKVKDYEIIYVDYDFTKINSTKNYWDYCHLNIYDKNLYKKVEKNSVGSLDFNIGKFRENFFNLIVENKSYFKSGTFFFNPIKVLLSDYIHSINSKDTRFEHINKLIEEIQNNNFTKEKFLVFLYSNISMKVPPDIKTVDTITDLLLIEEDILKYSDYYKLIDTENIYSFLNELSQEEISIEIFIKIYNKHKEAFLKLIEIGYLQFNLMDSIEREYYDLSHGERKLFTEMLMIFDAIKKSDKDKVLVVLDEPDLTLHPDWQKKYINEMIKLLSKFEKKKFHLIITSHSPFILSDLPKENVIFLEKDEKTGNCINATKKVDINPFGANIHTLLSHGFFMKDGLMGEFAKSKIDEAIKNLKDENYNPSKEEKEKLLSNIKIIGEDFLRTKLLDMYYKKFDDEFIKKQRKEELQKLQEKISKELEQL